MERGEGSKKIPDFTIKMETTISSLFRMQNEPSLRLSPVKEEPIDENDDPTPLQVVRPVTPFNNNYLVVSHGGPSTGPVRRGPGRPKGSKNMTKKVNKTGRIPLPPGFVEPNTRNNDRPTEMVIRPSPPMINPEPSPAPIFSMPVVSPLHAPASNGGPSTSTGPVRRGLGRPKGSKNSTKKVNKTGRIPLPPGFVEPNTRNNDRPTEMVIRPSPQMINPEPSPAPIFSMPVVSPPLHAPDGGQLKRGAGRDRSKGLQNLAKKAKKTTAIPLPPPSTRYIISQQDKENGNHDLVKSLLMRFDAIRRRLSQKEVHGQGVSVAIKAFKTLELYTNKRKRIGPVPGVNVGDIFYLWGEMGIVGLHVVPIGVESLIDASQNTMALCIVSSGKNADLSDDIHTLTYTGLGGTEKYHDGQACDQTLAGMNGALVRTMRVASPVRVVRSKPDRRRSTGNIYIYDGIYLIKEMWQERADNGFKVFKFKLEREPDQKPAFEKWKSIEQWRNGLVPRPGLILQDLSNGTEKLKVFLVNEVDEEKSPEPFQYVTSLKHPVLNIPSFVDCCTCINSCSRDCSCVRSNFGSGFPYAEGALVTRTLMIYECGRSCQCTEENCNNKMIHSGLKFSFEVFKTMECGWGLRSWDPIRAGSFICQYAGDIIPKGDVDENDEYIFDTTRDYKHFEWNYEPELIGEDESEKIFEDKSSQELVISGKRSGNVARFMNHSCDPNVFWQLISREEHGVGCLYVGLFAKMHIPPLTELRYDYGTSPGGKEKKICLCRSEKCFGSFG